MGTHFSSSFGRRGGGRRRLTSFVIVLSPLPLGGSLEDASLPTPAPQGAKVSGEEEKEERVPIALSLTRGVSQQNPLFQA